MLKSGANPDSVEGVEVNTGVLCPGNRSMEPFVGSVMTLENKDFIDEAVLCEIGEQFIFKFQKEERV